MAGNHGNAAYLNSQQQAAVMKQHQMLLDHKQQQKQLLIEQQKQFLMGQRQLLAEQVKHCCHKDCANVVEYSVLIMLIRLHIMFTT